MLPEKSDHIAISKWVMYIIAGMIIACSVLVMLVEDGVESMPYGVYGLIGAIIFTAAAIGMANYVQRQHH